MQGCLLGVTGWCSQVPFLTHCLLAFADAGPLFPGVLPHSRCPHTPGLTPPPHFCLGCFPTQNNRLPPFSLPDLPSEASSGPVSCKMAFLITHGSVSDSPLFRGSSYVVLFCCLNITHMCAPAAGLACHQVPQIPY